MHYTSKVLKYTTKYINFITSNPRRSTPFADYVNVQEHPNKHAIQQDALLTIAPKLRNKEYAKITRRAINSCVIIAIECKKQDSLFTLLAVTDSAQANTLELGGDLIVINTKHSTNHLLLEPKLLAKA
jgi:hypothetical protein